MKQKFIFIITTFYILSLMISIYSVSVQASATLLYPIKDSYVNSYEPTKNFGENNNLECGTFYVPMTGLGVTQACEAYIYFDFSEITKGWNKVELFLEFYFVSEPVELDLTNILDDWDESSITWLNRPLMREKLQSFIVLNDSEIIIDVSSYLPKSKFSICICSPFFQDETVNISSREDIVEDNRPHLEFYYNLMSYSSFQVLIGWIVGLSATGLIIWAIIYQKLKGERLFQKKENSKKIQKCSSCGYKNTIKMKFCYNCGVKLL